MRRQTLRIRIGLRSFELGPVRVKDWIEMTLAAQLLAEAEPTPEAQREAWSALIEATAGLAAPKRREKFRRALEGIAFFRVQAIGHAVALALMGGRGDKVEEAEAPKKGERPLTSREELMLPAYRVARILGRPIKEILDLDIRDFNREWKLADALLAGFEMELLSIATDPHVRHDHGPMLWDALAKRAAGTRRENASRWRKHAAAARRQI